MLRARPLVGVVASALLGSAVFYAGEGYFVRRGPRSWSLAREAVVLPFDAAREAREVRVLLDHGELDSAAKRLEACRRSWDDELRDLWARLEAKRALLIVDRYFEAGRYGDARTALEQIPADALLDGERSGRERLLAGGVQQLLSDATELARFPDDRSKMLALRVVVDRIGVYDSELLTGTNLVELAEHGVEDIDSPELGVERLFGRGETALALERARRCQRSVQACRVLIGEMKTIASARTKLDKLSIAKLLELRELDLVQASDELSESIDALLALRFEAAARKCRDAGDWACVDRQLAAASEADVEVDEGLQTELDLWAREIVQHAYVDRGGDVKAARAVLKRVMAMARVEARTKEIAGHIDEELAAAR
ncbi:MAG: hypothetical protein JNK82_37310 [Myxococcaceae bacterium]|nr:hypothetical protein [Myxococcaceae bacterium]